MAKAIPHPLLSNRRALHLLVAAGFGILCLLGCGVPGAPQPPSTGIPKFVGDLKAVRRGDTVTLTWTTPTQTSDGELIRKPGKMLVQRALNPGQDSELNFQTVSESPLPPALKDERGDQMVAKDSLAEVLRSGGSAQFATYIVLAQSRSGKSYGLPNRASVPLMPLLPTPQNVKAEPVPTGIRVQWDQAWPPNRDQGLKVQYAWRVMRKQEGANDSVMIRQLNAGNQAIVLVDDGIEWEKNYQYWIVPVAIWQEGSRKGEVESGDSPIAAVFAHDVFPPAAPSGLQAVYSAVPERSFIDITWTPNSESDLAGYNIYRHTAGEAPKKVNAELGKTPRFADPDVQAGTKYFYSVTAVDLRGNESGKSEETSELVPKE